jgi:hypothetical protein
MFFVSFVVTPSHAERLSDIIEEPAPTVAIQAVGVKRRHQVYIGGKAIDL